MQSVSQLYRTLWAAAGTQEDVSLLVDGVSYSASAIYSMRTEVRLFPAPEIGRTVSRQISVTLSPQSGTIPRMASLAPRVRLTNGGSGSEWLSKGIFFIDTRQTDYATGKLTLTGYDAMLKSEQPMVRSGESSDTWPKSCTTVMGIIAAAMGVELDSRCNLNASFLVGFPSSDMTMRQVMGFIGVMNGGNWCMSDGGKLLLVPLIPSASSNTNLGLAAASIELAPAFDAWTGVRLTWNDEQIAFAGTETGRVLEAECPWATTAIAQAILTQINGQIYRPMTAAGAVLDPAAELGDMVTVQGAASVIAQQTVSFDTLCLSDISAPIDEEIDHEYPYVAPVPKSTQRAISKTRADITVDLDSIRADVEDVESQAHSELLQLADSIQLSVSQATSGGGETYASITLRVGEDTYTGQILLDGNVNVSGQLSADALYAAMGDIADLQVNRLSTSRRIVKYLAGDTSDDNYIHASGEALQFVSGVYSNDSEQAENGNGLPIYWESDPNAQGVVIGTDGYPYKNGVRIYTTTTQTAFPVMVYTYDELVKATVAFENDGVDYIPVLTMGAGDTHGNNRFKLKKSRGGLNLIYTAANGKEVGLTGTTDGFLDPVGLRRIVSLDFSDWHNGEFTIESEGNVELHFGVAFNSQGIPILITGPRSTNVSVTI